MPTYTGAWTRQQYYAAPEAVHTASADHESRGQAEDPNERDWTAERVNLPPALEFYVDPSATSAVEVDGGLQIDRSDYMTHDHRGDHSEDLGAARAQNYAEHPIKGPGETYGYQSVPSFRPDNMVPTFEQLTRGVNSYPMNNPPLVMYNGEGFRIGTWEFAERGRLRKMLARVIRTDHGIRPLTPNTAYMPPARASLRNVPLWQSLARNLDKTEKRPMVRRTPTPLGEALAEDGGPTLDDSASIISAGF